MIIHKVNSGENLYNIARRYSVPATKILGDNDLYGDRLVCGDELLVLIPTRTETVKGKDTLDILSKKFGVRKESLLCANPSLWGKDKLRPGQVITIKHDTPSLGTGSALCVVNKGCKRENLTRSLPYATYITINAGVIEGDKIKTSFDGKWASDICKSERKIHLLGIKDRTKGAFLEEKTQYESLIDNMISTAKEGGYNGIFISAREGASKHPDIFCNFLLEARKRFIGCDLLLFTEIFSDTPNDASELSDGSVFNVKEDSITELKEKLSEFSAKAESSKVVVDMSSAVNMNGTDISIKEAKELCYRSGLSLSTDEKTLMCSFTYTRYKIGEGEKINITFPSLKHTKAKLEQLAELGFMGISFDADITPIAYLSMFGASFARADYSLPYEI